MELLTVEARRVRQRVTSLARAAGRGARGALVVAWTVVLALVSSLGGAAQVAGVAVAVWAAWEFDPVAGKLVLAVGLLFLGGAVSRVVREVRHGSTR